MKFIGIPRDIFAISSTGSLKSLILDIWKGSINPLLTIFDTRAHYY